MTASPTHRHDQMHRGQVPTDQLADGTATVDYVPTSNGDGTVTWAPGSGGGTGHRHTHERFVAAGGIPETFTLIATPLFGEVDVRKQGLSVDPDSVTLTDADVTLDTVLSDIVVVWYAKDLTAPLVAGALTFPGDDGSPAYITDGNYVSDPFELLMGQFIHVDITLSGSEDVYAVDTDGDFFLIGTGTGTYSVENVTADATDWRIEVYDSGSYDGGLTGSGTWYTATV